MVEIADQLSGYALVCSGIQPLERLGTPARGTGRSRDAHGDGIGVDVANSRRSNESPPQDTVRRILSGLDLQGWVDGLR